MQGKFLTEGIVLARTDYQEADRILTILTPDHGKVRVMAKGVRRAKSRLAGGIELFSVNELTLLKGRSELHTLVSSRLVQYWGDIVRDINRTMAGYELLKRVNKVTEDESEEVFYQIVRGGLEGLDSQSLPLAAVYTWTDLQLLIAAGHSPNLRTDVTEQALAADEMYEFDFDHMAFGLSERGRFDSRHIKLLRLAAASNSPLVFEQVRGGEDCLEACLVLVRQMGEWR